MRYRLRTLMVLLAVLPVVIWAGWWGWNALRPPPNELRLYHEATADGTLVPPPPGYHWEWREEEHAYLAVPD